MVMREQKELLALNSGNAAASVQRGDEKHTVPGTVQGSTVPYHTR